MTELQFGLRVIGTVLQVGGLVLAFLELSKTHRRYSSDHSGLIEKAVAKAKQRAKVRAQIIWNAIRGHQPARGNLYSSSLTGHSTVTLTDPPANNRGLDANAEASDNLAALAGWAVEDFDSIQALEGARLRLRSDLDETREWLREVQRSISEISEARVSEFALEGVGCAAWGLFITAVGTLVAALS